MLLALLRTEEQVRDESSEGHRARLRLTCILVLTRPFNLTFVAKAPGCLEGTAELVFVTLSLSQRPCRAEAALR